MPRVLSCMLLLCVAPLLIGAAPTEEANASPPPATLLPGFAAQLAQMPEITDPSGWHVIPRDEAWEALAIAQPFARQPARWSYALSLIGQGDSSAALGVLDVMAQDDPDLLLVSAFRLARGTALAGANRPVEALAMLTDPMLAANPEACLWRMMAREQAGQADAALAEIGCAVHAINQRPLNRSRPFILAAARSAIAQRQYARAMRWLRQFPDRESTANLLRGRALIGQGDIAQGRLRLERVKVNASPREQAEADLELIAALVPRHLMPINDALATLDRIGFTWRGDAIEERALRLGYALALKAQDSRHILATGGILIRYFDMGADATTMLATCQQQIVSALSRDSRMTLTGAAGLFWDNRDLAPPGQQGDALLLMLVDRLVEASLYERAADLLGYQMRERARDIEKGPVSERVARLYILAAKPDKAILALRESDQPAYPAAMLDARHRIEAVALYQLGRADQAMALLDDVPGTERLRSEMLWRRRDWQGLVARLGTASPSRQLGAVDQAVILRQAVALAMLGREPELAALRARYGAAFTRLPSGPAFALLTGPVDAMTSESIARAMAAIPTASVAGDFEPLLDVRSAPAEQPAKKG
ncbi:hypothetical protein [Sphingobium subterraneum]|nr:hypothetical protein [Sphingobium subterraneum]